MKRTINGRQALRPSSPHPDAAHWSALRVLKLAEQGHACAACPNDTASGYQLELHHRHYENWGKERPEDVVILCSLCHEYITSRFRFTDEYKVEAGVYEPPRPGLPPVEIHPEAAPITGQAHPVRPGLPNVDEPAAPLQQQPVNNGPKRIRPF